MFVFNLCCLFFNKLLDNSNEEYSESSDDKYLESSEGEYSDSSDEKFYIKKILQLGKITFFWSEQTKENKKRKASYLETSNAIYYRKYGPSGSFTKAAKGSFLITQYFVKKNEMENTETKSNYTETESNSDINDNEEDEDKEDEEDEDKEDKKDDFTLWMQELEKVLN